MCRDKLKCEGLAAAGEEVSETSEKSEHISHRSQKTVRGEL